MNQAAQAESQTRRIVRELIGCDDDDLKPTAEQLMPRSLRVTLNQLPEERMKEIFAALEKHLSGEVPSLPPSATWFSPALSDTGKVLPFIDLTAALEDNLQQEVPDVAETTSGKFLFYRGRINEVHGEPGRGKTNTLMAASISVIRAGGTVLFIDPEDNPYGFLSRMKALGADPEDIKTKLKYLHDPSPEYIQAAQNWANKSGPTLVILDGMAESLVAAEADENSATDVLEFIRKTLKPFAKAGAAVVVADHVSKRSKARGQYARGSGAKAGRYDGVSYEIVSGKPYSPQHAGYIQLKIAKDRNGGAGPIGSIVTQLHFSPGGSGRTVVKFRDPERPVEPFIPDQYSKRIVEHIEKEGVATASEIRGLIGKGENLDKALKGLIAAKIVGMRREGKRHEYFLVNRVPEIPNLSPELVGDEAEKPPDIP